MNHNRYREHRPASSLDRRKLGESTMDEEHVRDAIRAARRKRVGIVFLWNDLERMDEIARRFIEAEFDRLNPGAR